MSYLLYIASTLGALALLLMMPRRRYNPRMLGALLGAVTLWRVTRAPNRPSPALGTRSMLLRKKLLRRKSPAKKMFLETVARNTTACSSPTPWPRVRTRPPSCGIACPIARAGRSGRMNWTTSSASAWTCFATTPGTGTGRRDPASLPRRGGRDHEKARGGRKKRSAFRVRRSGGQAAARRYVR